MGTHGMGTHGMVTTGWVPPGRSRGSTDSAVPTGRLARVPVLTSPAATTKRPHRAFKARRRTELGLMVAAAVIIVAAYTLMILGNTAKVPADVVPLLVAMLGLGGVAHIANRIFVPRAHPVVLPIAFLLNGLGYVMILRIDLGTGTNYAPLQAAWTAGGVAAYVVTLAVVRRSRDLDRYRYLLLALGVVLLLLPLVAVPPLDHQRRPAVGQVRAASSSSRWSWPRSSCASSSPPTSPKSGSC